MDSRDTLDEYRLAPDTSYTSSGQLRECPSAGTPHVKDGKQAATPTTGTQKMYKSPLRILVRERAATTPTTPASATQSLRKFHKNCAPLPNLPHGCDSRDSRPVISDDLTRQRLQLAYDTANSGLKRRQAQLQEKVGKVTRTSPRSTTPQRRASLSSARARQAPPVSPRAAFRAASSPNYRSPQYNKYNNDPNTLSISPVGCQESFASLQSLKDKDILSLDSASEMSRLSMSPN